MAPYKISGYYLLIVISIGKNTLSKRNSDINLDNGYYTYS